MHPSVITNTDSSRHALLIYSHLRWRNIGIQTDLKLELFHDDDVHYNGSKVSSIYHQFGKCTVT